MFVKSLFWRFHLINVSENSIHLLKRIQPKKYLRQRHSTDVAQRHKEWKSVVGLEVHAQISSASKLFSGSGTDFSAPVNTQVAFFDAALPGTLPVLNKRCVEAAILTALALNCDINKTSMFDRKHYFYADLPSGYQITQQRLPLAKHGKFPFAVLKNKEPYIHEARIIQLQLEQDSGRSLHDDGGISLIDLNRAGLALMEIVFDADLSNGEEAAALVAELQYLLQCIGTCDGRMGAGSLRVDANVSVNKPGEPWGTRTEIKNIGSIHSVAKAVDYEIKRQISVLENGGKINNETRMFDAVLKVTVPMRDKETQQDYRFMPEPNLPPLRLQDDENIPGTIKISEISRNLPAQLPFTFRLHLSEKYKLPLNMADRLMKHDSLLKHFKEIAKKEEIKPVPLMYFLLNDVLGMYNKFQLATEESPVSSAKLKEVFELHFQKCISDSNKTELLELLYSGDDRNISEIVVSKKWRSLYTDEDEIKKLAQKVIEENPKMVIKYKKGRTRVINAFLRMIQESTSEELDKSLTYKILINVLNSM